MEFDNSQYNGQYNNASYGMPNPQPVKDDDDGGTNIDFFAWAIRIIKGWWLFLIFITIFMIAAFLKNMKWAPQYTSSALVIIEENKGMMNSSNVLMQGFVAEHAYRNVNNQVIMFGSFDLISRVIGKHPEFTTDYYTRGHFKTTNYYKRSPIDIKKDFVVAGSYNREFEFNDNSDGTYKIIIPEGRDTPEVILKGKYGEPLESSFFFLTVDKTPMFYQGCKLYFMFYEKEQLAMNYSSRLAFDFLMQGASVVKCTVTGGVPEKDQDFLNALCDEFLADNLARKNDAAIKTIDFIDEQMSSLSDSIRVSEGQLNNYRSSNFVSSTAGGSLLVSQYNTVVAKLSEMRLKESYLKYLKDYLQNNVEDGSLMAPTDLGINESALTSLVTKYTETQIKRNEVGAKSPLYTKYGRELDTYKVQINEVLKNVKVEMDLQKTELTAQMAEIEKAMQEQPYKEQQLQHIERRFKLNDDYYSFLMQKRADAQIQKASNSPDNIILERARFSTLTNGAEKNKTYSTYFIIGLLIPLGIIILKEMLVPYIRTEQEITKLSENRGAIMGVIRHTNSRSPVIVDKHPKSSVAESYRVIRTQIEYVLHRKENITVMITSTQSGDGKTYISANMAGVYAVTGKKTLLIDLDMRKPSVQSLLNIDYNKGISDYLTGDITLEQAIIKDSRYRFDMLLVGTIPPSPGELLKSDMMKRLMEKLKKEYSYIIVDTSPIGLVADAYTVMDYTDVILYSVRCGKTNKKLFKNTVNNLFQNGVQNIRYVFNDVNFKKLEYSRYYSNYYGAYGHYGNKYYGYYGYGQHRKDKYVEYFDESE